MTRGASLSVAAAALLLAACGGAEDSSGSGGAAGSAGTGGAAGGGSCDAAAVGVEVAEIDLNGYPPYAIDGCALAFVSSPSSRHAGALVLRDLATDTDVVLEPGDARPRRPSIAGDLVAWEATLDALDVVRVRHAGATTTLSGPFHHAGEPRVARDAVVLTAWLDAPETANTDVYLYLPASDQLELVAGGPSQQRFADVSATTVAFTDFAEDPGGVYDDEGIALADVVLYDRATKALTPRSAAEKQAYPMLGSDGEVLYLEWTDLTRPVPKLEGYTIRGVSIDAFDEPARVIATVSTDPPSIRPTARDGVVEWVQREAGASQLLRAAADGSAPVEVVDGLDGLDLYAPAAASAFTILATRAGASPTTLRAVDR